MRHFHPDTGWTETPPAIEWRATNELRWKDNTVQLHDPSTGEIQIINRPPVLQQLWQASNGETEWRNIPTPNE